MLPFQYTDVKFTIRPQGRNADWQHIIKRRILRPNNENKENYIITNSNIYVLQPSAQKEEKSIAQKTQIDESTLETTGYMGV